MAESNIDSAKKAISAADISAGVNMAKKPILIAAGLVFIAFVGLVLVLFSGGDGDSVAVQDVSPDVSDPTTTDLPNSTAIQSNTPTTLSPGSSISSTESTNPDGTPITNTTAANGGPAANGFPTNERALAAFNRAAASSRQQVPYQSPDGNRFGDPSSAPNRFVDLTSAAATQRASLPSTSFSISDIVTDNGAKASPPTAPTNRGVNGVFHAACQVSHFAYDDPIAAFGKPGMAHLHMFFGNTETNAFSTSDSILNSGNGSCQHEELNRTGYWVPAMLDGDGYALVPDYIQIYYEGLGIKDGADFRNFPAGLNYISGNAFATEIQPDIDFRGATFFCGWYGNAENGGGGTPGNSGPTIPDCDPNVYSHLQMNIATPYCWDGETLDWDPNDPNVIYPPGHFGPPCPASHPVMLPSLYYRITFDLRQRPTDTSTWYLSSDIERSTGELRGPRGVSMHADWWNGWHEELLDGIFDNCIDQVNVWCGPIHLGDGQLTDHVGKVIGIDDERISPEDILTACPIRETFDGNPRNIAYCIN